MERCVLGSTIGGFRSCAVGLGTGSNWLGGVLLPPLQDSRTREYSGVHTGHGVQREHLKYVLRTLYRRVHIGRKVLLMLSLYRYIVQSNRPREHSLSLEQKINVVRSMYSVQ